MNRIDSKKFNEVIQRIHDMRPGQSIIYHVGHWSVDLIPSLLTVSSQTFERMAGKGWHFTQRSRKEGFEYIATRRN